MVTRNDYLCSSFSNNEHGMFRYLDHNCKLAPDGKCYDPSTGAHYNCASYSAEMTHCTVNSREMLAETQGISAGIISDIFAQDMLA